MECQKIQYMYIVNQFGKFNCEMFIMLEFIPGTNQY